MQAYLWIKSAHLLFVMAWVAAAFYLPRILINLVEAGDAREVGARLTLMGRRLYRFGHIMFALAVLAGVVLWLGYRVLPDFPTMVGAGSGWLHAKLTLVALLLAHYIMCGRWLRRAGTADALPGARALRLFNEIPVFLLLGVIWLVLAKPF
jgi:putative membrane protein